MIPVILTTNAISLHRAGLAITTCAAWLQVPGIQLHVIEVGHCSTVRAALAATWHRLAPDESDCGCSKPHVRWYATEPKGSLRRRHAMAREIAGTAEWYVITDDDIVPPADLDIALGLIHVFDDPPWGLVAVSLEGGRSGAAVDGPVRDVANCGGLRFVRRGALPAELPPFDDHPGYDHLLTQAVRDRGLRVGALYHPHVGVVHLGEGGSTIWDQLAGQPAQER